MYLKAITFDVTRTLIHCPRVAEIYAEVLHRHGVEAPAEEIGRWISVIWQEFACRTRVGRDRFTAHPQGARGWWHDFLSRLCRYLEAPEPSRFLTSELYHRFARADTWEVYPEVRSTLEELQEMGLALAVVSNWDERLGPLLTRLDLTRFFDAIVISAQVGIEKPDPRIFQHALDLLQVPPRAAAHVGDSAREDIEGAMAAGMKALHLVRGQGRVEIRTPEQAGRLDSLAELPERVAAADWPIAVW